MAKLYSEAHPPPVDSTGPRGVLGVAGAGRGGNRLESPTRAANLPAGMKEAVPQAPFHAADYPRLDWRVVFGAWTLVGVLLIIQTYIAIIDALPTAFSGHLYTCLAQLYRAWMWAALTPLVFWLRRYLAARHPHPVPHWGMHLLAAVAIFAFGNVLRIWAVFLTFGYFRLEDFSMSVILPRFNARFLVDFYLYWVVFAFGYAFDQNHARQRVAMKEQELRAQLANAELAVLRQQIQPHFLFNSHNAITALIREGEAAKAVDALTQLSALLRQTLELGAQPDVELWRELDHAHSYLEIEQVRLEERLATKFDVAEDCLDALVPSLILQPLVENAVKHGISQRRNPGVVTVTARRDGDRLRLSVANDPAEIPLRGASRSGVGLATTRRRLERLFGPQLEFSTTFDTTRAVVEFAFPFRSSQPRSDDDDSHADH